MKNLHKYLTCAMLLFMGSTMLIAGNPDRQGEAGAAELLLNPWARSAGLHSMNTSTVSGIEAMRLNIAGLARMRGKELVIANMRLYEGSDLQMNAFGYGNKVGTNGAFGISLTAMAFGDIDVTTNLRPEGTGGTFSPQFFNIGLGYSYMYDNKVSVGILVRGVSETLADVNAFGLAVDAGVQYVAGEEDNFKLGISLRNVGTPMTFGGQGLSTRAPNEEGITITYSQRAQRFEMPSVLNIGVSYDFFLRMNGVSQKLVDDEGVEIDSPAVPGKSRELLLRGLANFTSNAFSRDQIGAGLELIFNDMFTIRGGYKQEVGESDFELEENVYSGVAGGASVEIPFNKAGSSSIGIDYAYRATHTFRGTHNFSVRLLF